MYKRLLAMLLVFVMMFSLLPVGAFAEGEMPGEEPINEPEPTVEPVPTEEPVPTAEPQQSEEPLPTEEPEKKNGTEGEEPATHIVTMVFFTYEESHLKLDEILSARPDLTINLKQEGTGQMFSQTVTKNGEEFSATLNLPVGIYYATASNGRIPGYVANKDGTYVNVYEDSGPQRISYGIEYFTDEATLNIALDFAEGSDFDETDAGVITATVTDGAGNSYEVQLSPENGYTAPVTIASGDYTISFTDGVGADYAASYTGDTAGNIELGKTETANITANFTKIPTSTVTVAVDFAEDSALDETNAGTVTATVTDAEGNVVATVELNAENGYSTDITLLAGDYSISYSDNNGEDYTVEYTGEPEFTVSGGEPKTVSATADFSAKPGQISVALDFAEDSVLGEDDVDSITATVTDAEGNVVATVELNADNGYSADIDNLPPGEYDISFSDYGEDGCTCDFVGETHITVGPGEQVDSQFTVIYSEDDGNPRTFDLIINPYVFDYSELSSEQIGNIRVIMTNEETGEVTELISTPDERAVVFKLPSGTYTWTLKLADPTVAKGYIGRQDGFGARTISAFVMDKFEIDHGMGFIRNEVTLNVSLLFDEASELNADNAGTIIATVTDSTGAQHQVELNSENGYASSTVISYGPYTVSYEAVDKSGYEAEFSGPTGGSVEVGNDIYNRPTETSIENTVKFTAKPAKLTVNLTVAEDSALSGDELGAVTGIISRSEEEKYEFSVEADSSGKGSYSFELEVDPEQAESWGLELDAIELDGYYVEFEADEYATVKAGEEAVWNITVKSYNANNSVTVRVELAEGVDESEAAYLRDNLRFYLSEERWDVWKEFGHNGGVSYSRSFGNLMDSKQYELGFSFVTGSAASVSCSDADAVIDLENGSVTFGLSGGENEEIVLVVDPVKQTGDITVIVRFAEESELQPEDLPDGLPIVMRIGGAASQPVNFKEGCANEENGWTYTFSDLLCRYGYTVIGVLPSGGELVDSDGKGDPLYSTVWLDEENNSVTIYFDINCVRSEKVEHEISVSFAEDSALKEDTVGSVWVDYTDGDTSGSLEFSAEQGWQHVVEYIGDLSTTLRGAERQGYMLTVKKDDGRITTYTLDYQSMAEKLIVNIVDGSGSVSCDAIVYVKDAEGNIVAQGEANSSNGYQCIFDIAEEGDYTISAEVKDPDPDRDYVVDEPKTIHFVPADGEVVDFLCAGVRPSVHIVDIVKVFDGDSELWGLHFPEGLTVTLTEANGICSRSYVLNEENNWTIRDYVPQGRYTLAEYGADVAGYERSTWFASRGYSTGASLRNAGTGAAPSASTEVIMVGEGTDICIFNSYELCTGTLTVTNDHGFFEYPETALDEHPGSGYEQEEYSYEVVIGDETHTITLAPGESYTFEDIILGTEYTVTAQLPAECGWNAAPASAEGIVGADLEDESTWDVSEHFDNNYYYIFDEDGAQADIYKVDADSRKALEGAEFTVYSDAALSETYATATTEGNGVCTFEFEEVGTYYLKETKAPGRLYEAADTVWTITVEREWRLDEEDGLTVIVEELVAVAEGLEVAYDSFVVPNERTAPGTLTLTNEDYFFEYQGEELSASPNSGYEKADYTYEVVIGDETYTVTIAPGESHTFEEIELGTEYTITPKPADSYNIVPAEPITGIVGADEEDESTWDVTENVDNNYYYDYEDASLTVIKVDALTFEELAGAVFGVYEDAACTKNLGVATTGADGKCSFGFAAPGTYYIKELKAPTEEHQATAGVKTVEVKAEWSLEQREGENVIVGKLSAGIVGLATQAGGIPWANARKTVDITVTKVFVRDEHLERPDSVTVVLYQDCAVYETVELNEANNWTYTWEDMPMGFDYVIDELDVAEGYTKIVTRNGWNFTVTNSGADIPETGDSAKLLPWAFSAMLSLCGAAALIGKKRKEEN